MTDQDQKNPAPEAFSPDAFFAELAQTIVKRRTLKPSAIRAAFAVMDWGHYLLDCQSETVLSHQWDDNADLAIVCSPQALKAMSVGSFDLDKPKPGELFLWSGDKEALTCFAELLHSTESVTSVRLLQTRQAGRSAVSAGASKIRRQT